jgi:putative transposase
MPRPPRLQVPGAAYHVGTRAVAGRTLYRTEDDRTCFLSLLTRVVAERDWVCGAYCLMTTHYHLLIRTPEADLASGMQDLNSCYAQEFNRRYELEGHAFFRRYHSDMIEHEGHLFEAARYIPNNPVRAGACRRAEDWPWSSYPAHLGLCPPPAFLSPGWLLELFGRDLRRARTRYRAFVEDIS